jgi:hypothetical protein
MNSEATGEATAGAGGEYAPPVDRLLSYPDPDAPGQEWADYVGELGLGAEHVPELIRMATDPNLHSRPGADDYSEAPVHAWRALGQLRAAEAVEPLLTLFDELTDAEVLHEELPFVFARIGTAAVPPLERFLAEREHDYWPRATIAEGLKQIAQAEPAAREEIVATLTKVLEGYAAEEPEFNALIIDDLLELRATEAAPVIERAFEADAVVVSMFGDWEDAQVELGLLEERLTPRPSYADESLLPTPEPTPRQQAARQQLQKKVKRNKSRKKLAKQSRKQNRKRR